MERKLEWFGTAEAARKLEMSVSNLYRLLSNGTIKSLRIGKKGAHRFSQEMIEHYLHPGEWRE